MANSKHKEDWLVLKSDIFSGEKSGGTLFCEITCSEWSVFILMTGSHPAPYLSFLRPDFLQIQCASFLAYTHLTQWEYNNCKGLRESKCWRPLLACLGKGFHAAEVRSLMLKS